jgi:hypothetical protein
MRLERVDRRIWKILQRAERGLSDIGADIEEDVDWMVRDVREPLDVILIVNTERQHRAVTNPIASAFQQTSDQTASDPV